MRLWVIAFGISVGLALDSKADFAHLITGKRNFGAARKRHYSAVLPSHRNSSTPFTKKGKIAMKRAGFTLIELLVVIAIIAILMALEKNVPDTFNYPRELRPRGPLIEDTLSGMLVEKGISALSISPAFPASQR